MPQVGSNIRPSPRKDAMSDWNAGIIEEFRSNEGRVGGMFDGAPLLLLHHRGAQTKTDRVSPLMYQDLGDGAVAIFASKAGADDNPDWLYNLKAHPDTQIEIGSETRSVSARIAQGDEHDRIWERQKREWPQFAEYEQKTSRQQIPVVVLEPR